MIRYRMSTALAVVGVLIAFAWFVREVAAAEAPIAEFPSSTFDGTNTEIWESTGTGFTQSSGRLEVTLVAPAQQEQSISVICRGPREDDTPGSFCLWIWNGEVHAWFGSIEIFRPVRESSVGDLVPGQEHVITLAWDNDRDRIQVLVDGQVTIQHGAWAPDMQGRTDPITLGWSDTQGNHVHYSGEAAFAVYAASGPVGCHGVGTVHGQPIPTPETCGVEKNAEIEVCWRNPEENVDGTALTDLERIRIHWGPESREYLDSFEVQTDLPGEVICAEIPVPEGNWFVAGTAFDAEGNESVLSNEVTKAAVVPPSPPGIVDLDATQDGAAAEHVRLVVGDTSSPVTVTWEGTDLTELELVEYGNELPTLTGSSSSGSWTFTPPRAGLYLIRSRTCAAEDDCGEWVESPELGLLLFFKLAAPGGGGIE